MVLKATDLKRSREPKVSLGKMSPECFQRVMDCLDSRRGGRGYSDRSREAARLILVVGVSITEAASRIGTTRQSVNQLMLRIRRRMESISLNLG